MKDIKQKITLGYKNAYLDFRNGYIDGQQYLDKATEYVFTSNIFKTLIGIRNSFNPIYQVEQDANEFFRNAFKPKLDTSKSGVEYEILRPEIFEPTRNNRGSIDITISESNLSGIHSKHGIEVKAINQSYQLIEKDISRLIEAMQEQVDFENSIDSCFVVFARMLGSNKNILTEEEFQKIFQKLKDRINKNLKVDGLKNTNPTLDFELEYFKIVKSTDTGLYDPDYYEYHHVSEGTGAIIGVLLTISRIPQINSEDGQ